jgi:preprotein translocase subunit Sss1
VKTLSAGSWYGALEAAGHRSRPRAWTYWGAVSGAILVLNLYASAGPTVLERALASLIISIAAAAIWKWLGDRSKGDVEAGFLPLFAAIFAVYYGLPIFTLTRYTVTFFAMQSVDTSAIEKALLLAALGLSLTLLGYYFPAARALGRVLPKPRLDWRDYNLLKLASVAFCIIGMVGFLVETRLDVPKRLTQYVGMISDLFYIGILTLFVLQLRRRLEWPLGLLLWGVFFPLRMALGAGTGQFGFALKLVLALVMAYAVVRGRIPWLALTAGFACFMVLQPAKAQLRSMVWVGGGGNKDQSEFKKMDALVDTVEVGFALVEKLGVRNVVGIASSRLAQVMIFAKVVDLTPAIIGYWNGDTYYPFLFKPIPRILYPDKPQERSGQRFGHRYRFIAVDDYTTSINLPQLVEFYANFGLLGVIIGSFMLGCVYRVVHDLFIHPEMGLGAIVGVAYVLTRWLVIESALSLVLGNIVQSGTLLCIVNLLIARAEVLRRPAVVLSPVREAPASSRSM